MAAQFDINELHWLLDIVQSIDVGVVVLDRDYRIEVWNSFMENHSGLSSAEAAQRSLFELFPEIDQDWFSRKLETAVLLGTRAFTIWEQRPYLIRFNSYQPITGLADAMYQNVTIMPLRNPRGEADHVCLIIYDVTGIALNKRQLEAANLQLREQAHRDGMTGLLNRRYWEQSLEREFARYQRYETPASLVMFDIDNFKPINDNHGHQTGDEVIREAARVIREHARETDYAGRYGGEEFVLLLPDTSLQGAAQLAERLRQAMERLIVEHLEQRVSFTISLGVAQFSEEMSSAFDLVAAADSALYQSKQAGRNRTTLHTSDDT
ncbi:diguanylate cyclase [Halopseudomonas phragmitis]|uniref:diguanylate cyclase n=1 Tax=Halopseudomonas phragmitis TaxID=1931241 RepID=A0A1V0B3R2_9GAMM|nr:diguanylate cyclase [Halopseudomonas phragmitis]AQZ94545.1 diguanylate cyclase [Halopseudomonas phragmitis]